MATQSAPPPMPKVPVPMPAGAKPGVAAGAVPPPLPAAGQPLPQAAPLPPQELEMAVPLDFWQQPWVQDVLPFVTSVTVHAAVILIGFLFFWGIHAISDAAPVHQDQVIVPDASMINDGPPGGVPFQGLGSDPNRQAFQDKEKDKGAPEGWADRQSRNMELRAAGGGEGDASDTIIGLGPGGGFGHGRNGKGLGTGEGLGGGEGDGGGPLAMFGTPGGGGIGPKGPVFGHGGNARKITFVCDASGSMLNKMGTLKRELSRAVQGLRAIQSFGIVFFRDENYNALDKSLLMATPENKIKAEKFLDDVIPKGETKPIPGIEIAFKQQPELIYILTDGDFPDNEAVLKRIRELNRDKKVKINTIAFVSDTDTDTAFMDLLKQIAKENNGIYKHVAENEL